MSFRLDRMVTLYFAEPLQRSFNGYHAGIPVLMYHSIADENERVHAYYRTATHPRVFAEHMEALREADYSVLGLEEAVEKLGQGISPTDRYAVITFDDGYRNFYTEAFPVLQKFGFPAVMYLPTGYIGETAGNFKGKDCLSWTEVRELERHGISFGSHTVNHPKLYGMGRAEIRNELFASKQTIENKLGHAVNSFAYPYAFPETDLSFKAQFRELLTETGYQNGVCTTLGRASAGDDPFFLKRLPANSCDDSRLFAAKLAGAYDWLAKPQRLAKSAKLARG